ncbi:lipopolysaccharide kinase InaA family protein [Pseudomonas sp. NFIX28]|uniref:lipopolysaccharide kinase InaA family protein n=1 Tax=Pseudomonas sp. NFIX28 TaxID=1566235 RepID=UPI000898D009|nr:lipopolysaccharide kinase InaA family protein [Pseudomonas sp. NFIX28]SDY80327.1 Lipopolysaccharide kinase (Kdo/WaaP) family protein [Pseudomonas sp. NFIX28]
MRHLRNLTRTLHRQRIDGVTFHIEPSHQPELDRLIRGFLATPEQHPTLDIPEDSRGVFLLEGERQWVLKRNRLTHWKKQLQNFLGLKRSFGLHDLTNEFINLSRVSAKSGLTPQVSAFGYKGRFPFLREEYLVVGFWANHCDVDTRLIAHPEQVQTLLPDIFRLFGQMLDDDFVHMDPHPKNILIGADGRLRLIDFECCAHTVLDRDFSLGFLLGYFYRFWFRRFISQEDYDRLCEAYLNAQQPNLDRRIFQPVYQRFRDEKVSRTTRYSILTCARAQAAFMRAISA